MACYDKLTTQHKQHLSLWQFDTAHPTSAQVEELRKLDGDAVFARVLEWEGIIGYDHFLRNLYKACYT